MTFSLRLVISLVFSLILVGCSDAEREEQLVDLFETASLDLSSIQFPSSTETVVSAGSTVEFSIEGLKSNGTDSVTLTSAAEWSLSAGAASSIDQSGRLSAAAVAESLTVTARVGILEASLDIRVSTAEFDYVVALDDSTADLDMCRVRTITPVGRYVDDEDNEEIRSVDSLIIGTVTWDVRNAEDDSASQRAYIETSGTQVALHALAAGDLVIRATAPSVFQGVDVTSADFSQTISNNLNSLKLCKASATDIDSCAVSSPSVAQDDTLELIAVGNYQSSGGSAFNENISRRVKWGTSNSSAASLVLAADYEGLEISGTVENTSTTLSAACGAIEQSLSGIDVSEGVILSTAVSCGSNANCAQTSTTVSIDELSVDSFTVTVNDTEVTDNTSLVLESQPEELELVVTANFTNDDSRVITTDSELTYVISKDSGQIDVIEESGSTGVFTVIAAGTAKILLTYRQSSFTVVVEIPL